MPRPNLKNAPKLTKLLTKLGFNAKTGVFFAPRGTRLKKWCKKKNLDKKKRAIL